MPIAILMEIESKSRFGRKPVDILNQNGDIAASLFTFCSKFNQNGDIAAGLLTF